MEKFENKLSIFKKENNCLPEQIFQNKNLKFLFTIGGHLVEDEKQYFELMKYFEGIGETKIFLTENIELITSKRRKAYNIQIETDTKLDVFNDKIQNIDNDEFFFNKSSFFVYGVNPNWGIYISENPTILIIWCIEEYILDFKRIYKIKGNGYQKIKNFVKKEYNGRMDNVKIFENNYLGKNA